MECEGGVGPISVLNCHSGLAREMAGHSADLTSINGIGWLRHKLITADQAKSYRGSTVSVKNSDDMQALER